ncbi:MAG: cysteine desulfurase [Chlorobium sp.]|nr:cysteine desulfurase [Chlorobium sp.]
MKIGDSIYLDYQATTPVDPVVIEAMTPHFFTQFGNPHSSEHIFGWQAAEAVDMSSGQLANLIGADKDEIVFTSGATESNNLALFGLAGRRHGRNKVLLSPIEHKSVLAVAEELQKKFEIESLIIPVNYEGIVDLDFISDNIDDSVLAISVIAVNNEIGTIQPLSEIGKLSMKHGIIFHCDAAQAPCSISIDVINMNIDLLSLSAHKMYGPKGIGALYVKREHKNRLEPQIFGGGQQNNLRSGTIPVPLCVGFGKSAELISGEMGKIERIRIAKFRNHFIDSLSKLNWTIQCNGPRDCFRHPGNANIMFDSFSAYDILTALQPKVAASSGSACTSGTTEPSYVLRSIGLNDDQANSSIRFSFGRFTTISEINEAVMRINETLMNLVEN